MDEEGGRKKSAPLTTEKDYHGDQIMEVKKDKAEPAAPEKELTEEEKMALAKK